MAHMIATEFKCLNRKPVKVLDLAFQRTPSPTGLGFRSVLFGPKQLPISWS